jgi:hypothetical protein
MNRRKVTLNVLTILLALTADGETIQREALCVTEGAILETNSHRLLVSVSKVRAYVNRPTLQSVSVDFTYLGPSDRQTALGSGEVRRQFGLKLRAEDACNLVYVMWRIEPESKLVVSVKSNPGQHTSSECGNRGYMNIKPARSSPIPVLSPNARHELRAKMNHDSLRAWIDNVVVWDGRVGMEALNDNGPVGFRSDNVKLEFTMRADLLSVNQPPPPCASGGEKD